MQSMYCRCCFYDLQQLDQDVCPECGEAFDRDHPESYLTSIPSCRVRLYGLIFAVAMTVGVVVGWVGPIGFLAAILLVPATAGTLCAINFQRRERSPGYGGLWGGLVGISILVLILHIQHVVEETFFYQGPYPEPFFEDGFVTEVFLYPVVLLVVFCPVGMIIGLIAGLIVSGQK